MHKHQLTHYRWFLDQLGQSLGGTPSVARKAACLVSDNKMLSEPASNVCYQSHPPKHNHEFSPMVILLLCNHTNHIASFPGSPHMWAKKKKKKKKKKERGGPGKIFHVRNVTGRENLITCGWTNELVHVLLTDYALLLVQLWKLYGQQNKTRQHYATSESSGKRLAYTNTDSVHLKITNFNSGLPYNLIPVLPSEWLLPYNLIPVLPSEWVFKGFQTPRRPLSLALLKPSLYLLFEMGYY